MDFTADELDTLLAALFELRVTDHADSERGTVIDELAWRLGGDLRAHMFGANSVRSAVNGPWLGGRSG